MPLPPKRPTPPPLPKLAPQFEVIKQGASPSGPALDDYQRGVLQYLDAINHYLGAIDHSCWTIKTTVVTSFWLGIVGLLIWGLVAIVRASTGHHNY
jgi:hypothetical protein